MPSPDDPKAMTARETPPTHDLTVQALIDALPFYVLLVDDAHHVLQANAVTGQALGVPIAELVGAYCPRAVHGLGHAYPGCPLEESCATGKPREVELYDEQSGRWVSSGVYPTNVATSEGRKLVVHVVRDVTDRKTVEIAQGRTLRFQAALNDLLHLSNSNAPQDDLLRSMLERVVSLPWLAVERRGAIFATGRDGVNLEMRAHLGLDPRLLELCRQVPFGRCMCGRAAQAGVVQFASTLDARHDVHVDDMRPHGHYCVPIAKNGTILGVLNVYLADGHERTDEEQDFLVAVSNVLAGVLERQKAAELLEESLEQTRRLLDGMVDVLSSTVELRDPYTAGHQRRVADLGAAIASEMGLPADRIAAIRVAGTLHDIGKIAVPSEILAKPGRLNSFEMTLIRAHAGVAFDILKPLAFPTPIAEIVRQHHERQDGSGYPDGLAGDAIHLEARVLAVADVVESMASHRPYRPALGVDRALDEIASRRGVAYDPDVADACARLFALRGYVLVA